MTVVHRLLAILVLLVAGLAGWAGLRDQRTVPPRKLLFGLGDEISAATSAPLYLHGGVNMVTSWYNGPSDLAWMSGYASTDVVSDLYQQGKALELVVWLADEPAYAVSPQFQSDLAKLIDIFKGNGPYYGPLYVVLYTEFETYSDQPGYDAQLRTSYLAAVSKIHSLYRQAYVALGFGGYVWGARLPPPEPDVLAARPRCQRLHLPSRRCRTRPPGARAGKTSSFPRSRTPFASWASTASP